MIVRKNPVFGVEQDLLEKDLQTLVKKGRSYLLLCRDSKNLTLFSEFKFVKDVEM